MRLNLEKKKLYAHKHFNEELAESEMKKNLP